MSELWIGILVGGAGRRMGGVAKGLLATPSGGNILEHLLRCCSQVAPDAHVVLLGQHAAYAGFGLEQLADEPTGVGPLGGVHALLLAANQRSDAAHAVVLGCDLPFLTPELLSRLCLPLSAAARAAHDGQRWNPTFACYRAQPALASIAPLLADGKHSMAALLDRLNAERLVPTSQEALALCDWDTPSDVLATSKDPPQSV